MSGVWLMTYTQASYNELIESYILWLVYKERQAGRFCHGNNSDHLLCTYYVPTISYVKNKGKKNEKVREEYGILSGEKKQDQI